MLVWALSFDSQLSCVFYLIKCIPIFSNVFPFSFFADSIINFPSLLDPIEDVKPDLDWKVFLRIFNLQSRPGLKKFFWESSIFNPDLDWRSFSENLQSSIQTWIEEVFLRIFNLQSSIQTWIEEVFLRIFNLQSSIRYILQLIANHVCWLEPGAILYTYICICICK